MIYIYNIFSGNGFGGAGGKTVFTLIYSDKVERKTTSTDIFNYSDNIILNGGRNANNSDEEACKIGATGSLCVFDYQNKSSALIDGKFLNTSNPLFIYANELSLINSTKMINNAFALLKMNCTYNAQTEVIVNSIEINNSTLTDIRLELKTFPMLLFSIIKSFVLKNQAFSYNLFILYDLELNFFFIEK